MANKHPGSIANKIGVANIIRGVWKLITYQTSIAFHFYLISFKVNLFNLISAFGLENSCLTIKKNSEPNLYVPKTSFLTN